MLRQAGKEVMKYALEEARRNLESKSPRTLESLVPSSAASALLNIALAWASLKALHKRINRYSKRRWLVRQLICLPVILRTLDPL
jgi:hypothetical protein